MSRKNNGRRCTTMITAYGQTRSIVEWSALTGIDRAMLYYRVHANRMTPEDMLTLPPRKRNEYGAMYEAYGESHSIAEWARIKDISYTTLRFRLRVLKMPLEAALVHKFRKRYGRNKQTEVPETQSSQSQ